MSISNFFKDVKHVVLHYRVKNCCFVVPVRIGLFVIGCLNIIMSVFSLIITADPGSVMPPFVAVQSAILEDNASKTLAFAAYSIELTFNCVLLCGAYRKDRVLLRVYMCFVLVSIMSTFLVYSMVFALLSLLMKIDIIMMNWVYQGYVIILVWSAIVQIKDEQTLKNNKNNDIVLYHVQKPYDDQIQIKFERLDKKVIIESQPGSHDKTLPLEKKTEETLQPGEKNIETLQPSHNDGKILQTDRKIDKILQPDQKDGETAQSEQKTNETVQPEQKTDETVKPEHKSDETVQPEQKNDETLQPKPRTKVTRKKLKKGKPPVTLETVNENSK